MAKSDDPPTIPPTRAVRSGWWTPSTAAMRGPASGEPPPTGLNYSTKSRATSGRKWLPGILVNRQVKIVDVLQTGAQADVFLVTDAAGEQGVAKVYHASEQIKEAIFEKVRGVELPHVVRMHDFGQDDGHWWETQEYAAHGTLFDLIRSDGPRLSSDLVREIVTQIHQALTSLHGLKIEHRDLKPANVLVRSRQPLDLAVTDFGVSSDMQHSMRRSGVGGTWLYAPPEGQGTLVGGEEKDGAGELMTTVQKERWDNWSLGMMIVEMLSGKHPFAGQDPNTVVVRLIIKNVDELVEGVTDANWRKLCRGLLRRDNSHRWGNHEVAIWLKNPTDARLVVAEEGSQATAGHSFAGKLYYDLPTLGAAFYGNWAGARRTWELNRNGLLDWIQNDLGQSAIVDAIEKAIPQVRKLNIPIEKRQDAEVLTIATLLAPSALPTVNGVELSLASLTLLVAEATRDKTAGQRLVDLLQGQLLKLAQSSPDGSKLAVMASAWESACQSYDRLQSELGRHGVNAPLLANESRIALFAAQLPGNPTLGALRERALKANSADAKSSDWFARMGSPSVADAGTLMIMPYAAKAAEQSVRSERHVREQEQRRRNYQTTREKYIPFLNIVFGFLIGAAIGGISSLIISAVGIEISSWMRGGMYSSSINLIWTVICAVAGAIIRPVDFSGLVENSDGNAERLQLAARICLVCVGSSIIVGTYLIFNYNENQNADLVTRIANLPDQQRNFIQNALTPRVSVWQRDTENRQQGAWLFDEKSPTLSASNSPISMSCSNAYVKRGTSRDLYAVISNSNLEWTIYCLVNYPSGHQYRLDGKSSGPSNYQMPSNEGQYEVGTYTVEVYVESMIGGADFTAYLGSASYNVN